MAGGIYKGRRGARYSLLRANFFAPWEARELSKVERRLPVYKERTSLTKFAPRREDNEALKLMIEDRLRRRIRFEKIAQRKIEAGTWRYKDLRGKWLQNLSRLYSKQEWRVKEGPVGEQQKNLTKWRPNPWAMYRRYKKVAPDPEGYESPWKKRPRRHVRVTKDMVERQREKKPVELKERRPYR